MEIEQENDSWGRKLEKLVEIIDSEIGVRIEEFADNLRLNYVLRIEDEEKNLFTKQKLKEVIDIIGEFEGELAAFIKEAVKDVKFCDVSNDLKETLIFNYISGHIEPEDITDHISEEELEDLLSLDYILRNCKYTYNEIGELIEGFALADLYHTLRDLENHNSYSLPEKETSLPLTPLNKSILFNGKKLNLTERVKIANEVLDFEGQIRKLKISDTEKYKLMAYILGNDVSNVRNVVNGTRPNKIRDKEINSYLKDLMK